MSDRSVSDRKLKTEIWIVLGLSLGASAVYAVVSHGDEVAAGQRQLWAGQLLGFLRGFVGTG